MKLRVFLTSGIILLSGCAVGPDYAPPEISSPPQFVSQDVLSALNSDKDDKTVPVDWWTGFQDDTLNMLVEKGLQNNLDIAASIARVKQARAVIRLADAGDNLRADIDLSGDVQERRELDGDSETTTTSALGAGLDVVQPIDIFGRKDNNSKILFYIYDDGTVEKRVIID